MALDVSEKFWKGKRANSSFIHSSGGYFTNWLLLWQGGQLKALSVNVYSILF